MKFPIQARPITRTGFYHFQFSGVQGQIAAQNCECVGNANNTQCTILPGNTCPRGTIPACAPPDCDCECIPIP